MRNNGKNQKLLRSVAFCAMLLMISLKSVQASEPTYGAWLDWTSFKSAKTPEEVSEKANKLLQGAREAGLNTIYLVAFRYGCAMFTEMVETASDVPKCNENIDYYGLVKAEAEKIAKDLEVVPWIERPIGVGRHELIFAKAADWYEENNLLIGPDVFYDEAGFKFPVMDLSSEKIRDIMIGVSDSLVVNYEAKRIHFDDHLRLPKSRANDRKLKKQVIDFGKLWFESIKEHDGVLVELAPLVLDYSIRQYGTDWTKWKGLVDRVVIQCYKKTVTEMRNSGACHQVPSSMRKTFFGIGIYVIMWGKKIQDKEFLGMIRYQVQKDSNFAIFTLERIHPKLRKKMHQLTTGMNYEKGRLVAKDNGTLEGAWLRKRPKQLSELSKDQKCKLKPGEIIRFDRISQGDQAFVKIALPFEVDSCPGLIGHLFVYNKHFDRIK